jgi:hypothetical protein
MEFKEVLEILMSQDFSEKELKQLQAITDIRLGNFSARESKVNGSISDSYVGLFHDRLKVYLSRECDIDIPPIHIIKKVTKKTYNEMEKAASFLYGISESWNVDKSRTRNFAIGVFHLYCQLTVGYLRQTRVPISLKSVLQHTDKFQGLVDMAFPGYVESRMIKIIILGEKARESFGNSD